MAVGHVLSPQRHADQQLLSNPTFIGGKLNVLVWSSAALQLRGREDPGRFTANLSLHARRRTTSAAAETACGDRLTIRTAVPRAPHRPIRLRNTPSRAPPLTCPAHRPSHARARDQARRTLRLSAACQRCRWSGSMKAPHIRSATCSRPLSVSREPPYGSNRPLKPSSCPPSAT